MIVLMGYINLTPSDVRAFLWRVSPSERNASMKHGAVTQKPFEVSLASAYL